MALMSTDSCFFSTVYVVATLGSFKGTFYSESAGEMWNRHIKVPKIVPGPLFPVSDMSCGNKMVFLTFFCVDKINLFKARMNMY